MNPKSALLAFALFFACLTLAAQQTIVVHTGDTAASVSIASIVVGTARFDTVTPLSAGAFERMSPRSSAVVGHVDLLLGTMASSATPSFVTTGFDLADRGADGSAMAPAPINPEPATYAWMALGLGAIGFSRRHRQSRAD